MKKTQSIEVKKDIELLTPQQQLELEKKLPQWVQELAASGTAVLRWNTEFLILIEELLRKDHGFTEGQLVKLEKSIKETLPHLHKMSLDDLVLLRPKDMEMALGIIDQYKKMEKSGLALPSPKKLIK